MKRIINVKSYFAVLTGLFLLIACFPLSGNCEVIQTAVISTVASDYSSGAHSVISVEPAGGPRIVQNNLLPTSITDITVTAYENYFYRIERFQADNVTKFDIAAPNTPIWQFSTLDEGEIESSNPYDLIFVSSEKAYLLRYGSTKAWIVNPSATTQAEFKIGELDLGAYADSDGIPEMQGGVIANGKFYISMQRLDRDNSWVPSNDAYVAVFDTLTNTEIDTATPNDEGVKGIRLPVKNLGVIQYLEQSRMIYVQGVGDYGSSYSGRDPEYSGGIAGLDPDSYAVTMIVDDGDTDIHPYGNISGMNIVSPEKGYFVGYAGWGDNTLYMFNPATGNVSGPVNDYLNNKNISGMEAGAFSDENAMLWVCNATDAEVVIINTFDNSIDEKISTNLNPTRVVFTQTAQNSNVQCAKISETFDISIPGAEYTTLAGPMSLSLELQYFGEDENGNLLWKLQNLKEIISAQNSRCADIRSNLDIAISCAEFGSQLFSVELAYLGENDNDDLLWKFAGLSNKQ